MRVGVADGCRCSGLRNDEVEVVGPSLDAPPSSIDDPMDDFILRSWNCDVAFDKWLFDLDLDCCESPSLPDI